MNKRKKITIATVIILAVVVFWSVQSFKGFMISDSWHYHSFKTDGGIGGAGEAEYKEGRLFLTVDPN